MKSTYVPIVAILVIGVIFLSGCAQQSYDSSAPATGDSMNDGSMMHETSETQLAQEFSSGTGMGPNDVTTEELDAMQDDLDSMDVDVESASESDI